MSLPVLRASSWRAGFTLLQTVLGVTVVAVLATVALWGVPQWRARSAGTELVAAARAASLGELGSRTFETAPAGGASAGSSAAVTSSGGSARVETLARWSEGEDWGVVLTHAWDRRQACVATSAEPTPRCGPVDQISSGGSGSSAPSGVTGSLVPMSRAAAESQWPTVLAGRTIPTVPARGGLVVADARALVATPWASMPVVGGGAGSSGADTTAAAGERTAWVTWRQGTTVLQSGRASDTTAAILVAAVPDAETPVELWLVSSSGRVRADGGSGGSGGGSSGSVEPFSLSTLTPVAGAPVLLDGRAVRVGTDSSRAWNWVFGSNLIPSSSSVQNIVRFPTAGTYTITLSTRLQSGQVVTQSRTVTVSSGGGQGGSVAGVRPRAVLTASGTFVAPNQAVSMSLAQSTTPAPGGISTYRFVSGAGSAQGGVATSFTTVYRSAGTYTALGIITDAAGVVDTARLTITVATGGAPLDGARSSLNVLPLTDRVVGGEARVMPVVARVVDVNGLGRGSVVPTVTVSPVSGTVAAATASAFSATSSSTGEATGTLTIPSLAPGVTGTWELALRTGGASGPVLRRDTVTFTGIADVVAAPVPLVGRLSITSDVPQGSPVLAGQPIAPALVGQLRSLDGTTNLAVEGVPVSVVFQQGNGTLSGASGVTDGAGRVVLAGLSLNTVAGSYQLALSADGYVPATTRVFDVLTALEGSRLSLLQQPALTMIRGQTNVVQPSVRLLNADGSPAQIPGVSVAALVASSTARGGTTLTGATAITNGAGVATFSSLRLNGLPGLVTLRFAANGYQPAVARSIQLNAPAPFVSLDTAWSPSLRHGQVSAATPVITLRDIQDRVVGTAGSSGGSGTGITVSVSTQSGELWLSPTSATTTTGVARLPDFRAFALRPVSRTVSIRAAGFDSATFAMNVGFPPEGGATGLRWLLVSGAPSTPLRSGTATGPIVFQLVDASNTPVAAAGYPMWLGATSGRTLAGQDNQGRAGGGTTDATGRVTVGPVTIQGAAGSTGLITRGRESYEDGVGKSLPTLTLPVTLLAGAPTTATRSGATTISATDGTALAPITVQLRDGSGNAVAESGATVTLTATGGVTFAAGSASATTDASGAATIAAAIPQGLTGTVSLSATIVRDAATVAASGGAGTLAPALGSLSLVGTPVATVESRAPTTFVPSGGTFATALQVQLRDAGNRAVPISGVSIQLAIDSTGASADEQASTISSGATAVTNASGVATFSSLVLTGSGTVRLTATAPALASVTANAPTTLSTRIRIAPAPVSALAITSAPSSGLVGVDLANVSVELRDASNGRVPEAGRVVTISLDPASGWTGTLSGTTSRTTDATGRVTFTGLRLIGAAPVSGTGAPRLVASLTGATSAASGPVALSPGRVATVSLLSAPDTLFVDVPASIVAQARDVAGNATADVPSDYRLTFGGGGVSHHEGMRHAVFAGGTGQATFTFMPRLAGLSGTGPASVRSFSFFAEQPSCTGCGTPSFTASRAVRPGPARQVVVTQQPTTQQMGAPIGSALRLSLLDASGNAPTGGPGGVGTTLAGVPLSIAVATSLTPGRTLESVAGQTSDLTSLTDATGTATFAANTLRLTGSTGAIRLIGSGDAPLTGLAGASLTGTAGAATALQWVVAPPSRGRIGVGLTAMSVRQIDAFGNPVVSPTKLVTLEPVDAGYTVGGHSATTTGSGTAGFGGVVISGPRGLLTLRATADGLTAAVAPAAIDLSSGSAAAITLVRGLPATLSVDAAIATSQSLQVQLVDAGGFPVYEAGRTLTLNLPGTSSIPAGRVATTNATGLADFGATRVRGAAPSTLVGGSVTDANGLPALSLASIALTVGAPSQFTLLTPVPTTVAPGMALSPVIRAQLRDVSGNATPVAGRELRFFAQDGSGGDGYPQNALVATTTDASGIATFAPIIPNAWLPAVGQTIGAQVRAVDGNGGSTGWPGFNQTTGLTLTVSAGAATQIGIVSAPATLTVDSPFGTSATDSVIAQIRDADGNAVALSGRTATLTLTDGATGALSGSTLTATSNASGRLAFALTGRSYVGLSGARSWTVTASAGSPTLTAGTRAVTVTPGAATSLAVTTAPSDTAAVGLALARQPVVEFRDAGGNRATGVNGVTVTLFDGQSAPGLSLAGTTASSVNGVAQFSSLALSGPLATYSLTASATVGATPLAVELPVIVLGVGQATQLAFVSGFRLPDQLAIGVSSLGEPRLQLRDEQGNATPQSGVNITATLIEGPGGTLAGTTTRATTGTGVAAFPGLTLTGLPGSHVIEFSTSTFSVRDTVIVPVGLMDASQSTLSASPTTIAASDASNPSLTTITLTARDNTGVPRPSQAVRIILSGTASSGATAVGGLTATTNASGVATFQVRTTRAGTLTVTGVNNSTAQQMTQTVTVTATAGAAVADSTLLTLSRSSMAPTGTDTALATVTVRDRFLNPVAGASVALTATPSTGLTLQTGGVTNAQGQTFLAITGTEEVGTTIGVTVNGQTATGRTAVLTLVSTGPGGVAGSLQSWVRADTGLTLTGSQVSGWSWRGIGAVAAPGMSLPTWSATGMNGRPAVVFSGSQGLRLPSVTLGAQTVFAVFRMNGPTSTGLVWEHTTDYNAGAGSFVGGSSNTTTGVSRSGLFSRKNMASATWAADNVPRVATMRWAGTHASHILRLNGVVQTLSSNGSSSAGTSALTADLFLGHRNSGPQFGMNGAMSEFVAYNRSLSDAEVQAVEQDLILRWGLNMPTASFTASLAGGQVVTVDASASTAPMGVASYAWDFGDLSTGSGVTASRTYTTAGTYVIGMTITDALGRTATQTQSVDVYPTPGGISPAGLQAWLRADSGVVTGSGGTVTSWAWRGVAAAQAGSFAWPTWSATGLNGRPALMFNGSNQGVRLPNVTLGAQTVFLVSRTNTSTIMWEHSPNMNANQGSYLFGHIDATIAVRRGNWSAKNLSSLWASDNVPRISVMRYDGTHAGHQLRLNGVNMTLSTSGGNSNNPGTAAITNDLFLGNRGGASSSLSGAVSEFLVFNRNLTVPEIQAVEQEMALRWGLVLPTAAFTATPGSGLTVNFDASATVAPLGVASYAWAFGDLSTGSGVTTSRTYTASGDYPVTLTVTDVAGRTSSVTRTIPVAATGVPADLAAWWRADVPAASDTSGGRIWRLQDLSGNGRTATASVGQGPLVVENGIAGRRALRLDRLPSNPNFGSGSLAYDGTFLAGSPYTIFVVERSEQASQSHGYLLTGSGTTTGTNLHMGQRDASTFTVDHFNQSLDVIAPAGAGTRIWTADQSASTATMWQNGVQVGTISRGLLSSYAGASIGTAVVGWTAYPGLVGEILIYRRVLSAAERNAVIGHLNNRWRPEAVALSPAFTTSADGLTVSFNASSSTVSSALSSYAWDFGDLTTGSGVTTSRTYTAPGSYTVALTITDTYGRTATTSRSVTVGQVAAFAPLYWFRADQGLTMATDSTISSWSNLGSVSGAAIQPTLANRPRLSGAGAMAGRPTIRFGTGSANSNHFFTLPATPAAFGAGATYFVVFRPHAWPGAGVTSRIVTMTSSPTAGDDQVTLGLVSNAGQFVYTAVQGTGAVGGAFTWLPNVPLQAPLTYSAVQEADGMLELRWNGGNTIRSSRPLPLSVMRPNGWIAGSWNSDARPAMDLAELLVIDRPVTTTERAAIEAELQTRWGPTNRPLTLTPELTQRSDTLLASVGILDPDNAGIRSTTWTFSGTGTTVAPGRFVGSGIVTATATVVDQLGRIYTATATASLGTLTPAATSPLVWLRTDVGSVFRGDTLVSMRDLSGNNYHAQVPTTPSQRPRLTTWASTGAPALAFTQAQQQGIRIPAVPLNSATVITVIRYQSGFRFLSHGAPWCGYGTAGLWPIHNGFAMELVSSAGSTTTTRVSRSVQRTCGGTGLYADRFYSGTTPLTPTMAAFQYTGGTLTPSVSFGDVNRTMSTNFQSGSAPNSSTTQDVWIGRDPEGLGTAFTGQLVEVLIWNRSLSAAERTAVWNELRARWVLP